MEVTILIPALRLNISFPQKLIVVSQVMMGIRDLGQIGGDMFKSVYDPIGVGADAFSMANMKESEDAKIMTSAERDAIDIAKNHAGTDHATPDAERNVQSDWDQRDENEDSFILNKPNSFEAFPIGSIFLSINADSPDIILGYGSWERFAVGKMLIGVDPDDRDFETSLLTGGSKEFLPTGTVSEPVFNGNNLPTHIHSSKSAGTPAGSLGVPSVTVAVGGLSTTAGASNHTHAFTGTALAAHQHDAVSGGRASGTVSAPSFSGKSTSSLNPYVSVYMWLRREDEKVPKS
jgi:hypothetical protein